MFDTATVTTRPLACWIAVIFPAASISAMSQPPKMSPIGLVSAGIAGVRLCCGRTGSRSSSPLAGVVLVTLWSWCNREGISPPSADPVF